MAWSYKKWYRENKSKLSRRRKRRYHNDESFREQVKDRANKYYQRRRRKAVPVDRTVIRSRAGEHYISIGKLATFINRKSDTIRQYHRTGVLPSPSFYDTRGWRLYTQKQARLLRRAFMDLDSGRIESLSALTKVVQKQWEV